MFEDNVERLAADLSVSCTDDGFMAFKGFAVAAVVALPFGIPLFLFHRMWRVRGPDGQTLTVKKNPEYVTLVSFKPLFQFCKRATRHRCTWTRN